MCYIGLLRVSAVEWKVSVLRVERADGNKVQEIKARL